MTEGGIAESLNHATRWKESEMVTISGLGAAAQVGRKSGRAGASRAFSVPADAAIARAGTTATAEILLGNLLSLQEDESGTVQDREARRHGRDMLAELEARQHAMLRDTRDIAALRRLAALAADVPQATDPRLSEAMRQIALRAAVELARYGLM
jgi:hypothetical protein